MITLNAFLRKLPELAVDGMSFRRDDAWLSTLHIHDGVWKLHKIGYNEYALDKIIGNRIAPQGRWHSEENIGDIHLLKVSLSFRGVIVLLGKDVNRNGD